MNLDKDFIQFVKLIRIIGIINPEILDNKAAMFSFYIIIAATKEEFRWALYSMKDQKAKDIHLLYREAYEYYLLYGGMLLERSEEFRERYYEIMRRD